MPVEVKSTDLRAGAGWVKRFNRHFQGHAGAETRIYLLEAKVPNYTIESFYNTNNNSVRIIGQRVSDNKILIAPFLKLGLEWKPQSRVGIGIFGHVSPVNTVYDISQKTSVIAPRYLFTFTLAF